MTAAVRPIGRVGMCALAMVLLTVVPAAATTVISYSEEDGAYGWCAGYSKTRAHRCAEGYCVDAGGTACEPVAACRGGWGAIAFAQNPATAVAAICGTGNAFSARNWVITHCTAAANTLCWTEVAFNRNGSKTKDTANEAFDRAWYAQIMLQMRHYDPGSADGKTGPKTRQALADFQADVGLEAHGRLDDATFQRLLDAAGGPGHVAKAITEGIVEPSGNADRGYAYAAEPAPAVTISDSLADLPEAERRARAAAILSASGHSCTVPAESAERPFDEGEIWLVECAEGGFTLFLEPDGTRIIMKN